MAEEGITWDEATKSDAFVQLDADKEKVITIKNWVLKEVEKFGNKQVEFVSEVVTEDGEALPPVVWDNGKAVSGKLFTTTSNRLKKKLRPLLESKVSTESLKLSILKVGI